VDVSVKPGNRIEVLPAAVGRLLVRLIVTVAPSATTMVGPGTCMVLQLGAKAQVALGTNTGAEPVTQPYPHE
jgi:hypothetical protein